MRQSSASRVGPLHNRRCGMRWQPFVVLAVLLGLIIILVGGNAAVVFCFRVFLLSLFSLWYFCSLSCCLVFLTEVVVLMIADEASRIHAHSRRGGVPFGASRSAAALYRLSCPGITQETDERTNE